MLNHVESCRSDKMVKHGQDDVKDSVLESPYCDTVLFSTYAINGSVSKVNRSGADAQVVSCHCYLVYLLSS